jgi:hypothetical protein
METQVLNQENQFQKNQAYSVFVKKALEESELEYEKGNYRDYAEIKADLDKKYFQNT